MDAATFPRLRRDLALQECPDCGLVQQVGRLRPGQIADCERCGTVLRVRRRNSLGTSLALALAALILLVVAAISPLMGFRLAGQVRGASLSDLPGAFEGQDMPILGVAVLATTMLAPFLRLLATIMLLGGLRRDSLGGGFSRGTLIVLARLRNMLRPWAMVEVFLLGLFVAYTRLAARGTVDIGIGLYALVALMIVTAWADVWLDDHALWNAIGRRGRQAPAAPGAASGQLIGCQCCHQVSQGREGNACFRCDTPLRHRKPNAVARTWALLIAAAILYIPANVYPVLTLISFGQGQPSTILGGVQELIEYRMWPLAILVFVASVLVPMLKLVGLIILLVTTQRRSGARLLDRTRLYRLVELVGRWSMIDVFMLAVLTALVRMGLLASVTPGAGAVAFCSVVVLTMLAALSFDPRLMWDAAGAHANHEADPVAPQREAIGA